jgi:hypothetical protein
MGYEHIAHNDNDDDNDDDDNNNKNNNNNNNRMRLIPLVLSKIDLLYQSLKMTEG